MQGHGVKLLREGHRASPTHGTTAPSIPGCCCYPEPRGCITTSQWTLLGCFFPQVFITPPSPQARGGTAPGLSAHRSITCVSLPFASDE